MRDFVNVELVCDRCRRVIPVCSPVNRKVPEGQHKLRCTPSGVPISGAGGGGGGGGGLEACSVCGLSWHMDSSRLQQRVDDAARGGWGEHIRRGAIVLICGAA